MPNAYSYCWVGVESDELTTTALNGGRVKAITMGDIETIGVRRLYNEGSTVVVSATFCLLLNKFPNIEPADAAVAKRTHSWDMRCTFVDKPDERIGMPNVHATDKDLSKSLRRDEGPHDALFWILADAYKNEIPTFKGIKMSTVEALEARIGDSKKEKMNAIASMFECTDNEHDSLLNSEIQRHAHKCFPKIAWTGRNVYPLIEDIGAKKGTGQHVNKSTSKMERFYTHIKIRSETE